MNKNVFRFLGLICGSNLTKLEILVYYVYNHARDTKHE